MINDIKGSRILVTGGAGFVGSFIVEQLLEKGVEEIVVIDNLFRGSRENMGKALESDHVKLIEGDIRDRELVDKSTKGIDYCFHLAALRITQCAAEPREALEVMYDGTFNVLEASAKHNVKRVLFSSTASIYGQADSFPTDEMHHPYNNRTLYGSAKIANELMLRSFNGMYGLNYNIVRYFNIYGPRMDTHGKYTEVLIKWYNQIKGGRQPLIYGDGKQTMDFVYVEDVARASIKALESEACNDVFNVASGEETSLEELCKSMLSVMGSDLEPEYVVLPEDRKMVEVQRRLAGVEKAKNKIGFESSVDLNDGLKKLVEWLESKN